MATPEHTTRVTAELKLTPEALAKLKERANGHSLSEFLSTFVEAEMKRPSLDELLAPVRAAFDSSGTTDAELAHELERAKHEARAERHRRSTL